MQVFLPYPDLKRSVCCLDPKRLGNQVYRECLTLIRGGWPNHPCAKMWRGYGPWIFQYAMHGLEELVARGFDPAKAQNTKIKFIDALAKTPLPDALSWMLTLTEDGKMEIKGPNPPWFGDDRLHSSHRASLLYKNYDWYRQFGWEEKPAIPDENGRLPYYWPTCP